MHGSSNILLNSNLFINIPGYFYAEFYGSEAVRSTPPHVGYVCVVATQR